VADAPPVARSRRALVVDDEPHIRRVLEVALGVRDLEVMLASDGMRGLDELGQEAVDLAILDFMMPASAPLRSSQRSTQIRTAQTLRSSSSPKRVRTQTGRRR